MIIREDAIYGRQSVDRKDSISIESQIEFCKYELRGGNFRKYTDKGYSGKNTDRPKFQEVRHVHPDGASHAEYLHRVRPA